MALLKDPSDASRQIMQALNLPKNTVAFTLRMRAGEIATLDVETYAEADGVENLVTVLRKYKLKAMEDQNASLKGNMP